MDGSSGWLIDTLDVRLLNIPKRQEPLTSMTPVLAVNSKVLIQSADEWNKETELSASSNALKSSHCTPTNHHESTDTSHNVHQPLGNDDAKLEPLLKKGHTKSRRGCENCKKRRIKVYLTLIRKTED